MFRGRTKKYLRKKSDLVHDYMIFGLFLVCGFLFFKTVNKNLISDDEKKKKKQHGI